MQSKWLTFLLALAIIPLTLPDAIAQQGNEQQDEQQDAKEQTRSRRGKQRQRGRKGMRRPDNAPQVGDLAPTFKLKSLDGNSVTDLAEFQGKRPVVLLFGSYT